jgi:hypothetical protein
MAGQPRRGVCRRTVTPATPRYRGTGAPAGCPKPTACIAPWWLRSRCPGPRPAGGACYARRCSPATAGPVNAPAPGRAECAAPRPPPAGTSWPAATVAQTHPTTAAPNVAPATTAMVRACARLACPVRAGEGGRAHVPHPPRLPLGEASPVYAFVPLIAAAGRTVQRGAACGLGLAAVGAAGQRVQLRRDPDARCHGRPRGVPQEHPRDGSCRPGPAHRVRPSQSVTAASGLPSGGIGDRRYTPELPGTVTLG